ncbi:MAG: CDP-diacylglycerol--glycerol-3-phosphate 3-phosphatidyltransferase [Bacteroidota bacterium]
MKRHLPNSLTVARIALTPVYLWCMVRNTFVSHLVGLLLFLLLAISDYWDGKLARKYNAGSRIGQFLDPLADKVLVLGAFIVLPLVMAEPQWIPWWAVIVIVVRDVVITVLRTASELKGQSVTTLDLAKAKTTVQFVFLIYVMTFLVLVKWPKVDLIRDLSSAVLYSPFTLVLMLVVVGLTAWTGIQYFMKRTQQAA